MRPMLSTFIRLTVVITVALIAIVLLGWALHLIVIAAVIAAVVVGALFLYNIFRRRSGAPVIR
jgi:4-hydroxybenzoate polyprenyltransferase